MNISKNEIEDGLQNAVRYSVTLYGTSPLLMHKDDVLETEKIAKWRKDPQNKSVSVAGDDRSPAWTWITYLYSATNSDSLIIDANCIMTMLREAGSKMSTGKGRTTFKAITQYGLYIEGDGFEFFNNGEKIKKDWIANLWNKNDFDLHLQAVREHKFDLFLKRARISQTAKHVRVRPIFKNWSAQGYVVVIDEELSGLKEDVLQRIFSIAGNIIGLGDWRPSSGASGPYGKFKAEVKRMS